MSSKKTRAPQGASEVPTLLDSANPEAREDQAKKLVQTYSGQLVDLIWPRAQDVNFEDIAHHLAGEARYYNAPSQQFSVAQHSVMGARHSKPRSRAYFLLHDGPEYVWRDPSTPSKEAMIEIIASELANKLSPMEVEVVKTSVAESYKKADLRHAEAIYVAAGLQWPLPEEIEFDVGCMDRAMLLTEWPELMQGPPPAAKPGFEKITRLSSPLGKIWTRERAREEFMNAARALLPCFGGAPADIPPLTNKSAPIGPKIFRVGQ